MISPDAPRQIMELAKKKAESTVDGGLQKKLNDLTSYGTTAGIGGLAFAISHIPLAGPVLSKIVSTGASMGATQVFKHLQEVSPNRADWIRNTLFVLERSACASIRQAYNTYSILSHKLLIRLPLKKDCQEAYDEAFAAYLAQSCVEELEEASKVLEKLANDLRIEAAQFRAQVQLRMSRLPADVDAIRSGHPRKICMGLNKCYWQDGHLARVQGHRVTPFSSIGNDDL